MGTRETLAKALRGSRSISFRSMQRLMEGLGFRLVRVKGSHHIYEHPDIPELVNLQNADGEAKPYQVKQVLKLVERHDLSLEDDE